MPNAQYSQTNSFGEVYFLFSKIAKLRAWKEVKIYFFVNNPTADVGSGKPEPFLPADKTVRETRSGKLVVESKVQYE